jgi:hypothetical protein
MIIKGEDSSVDIMIRLQAGKKLFPIAAASRPVL